MKKNLIPKILVTLYFVIFITLAFSPYSRFNWLAENIPALLAVIVLILTRKKFQFSNFTYTMMFIGIIWHTVGGHFTYERVPFDFINDLFGFARNNYDRFGHFTAGFFALPFTEYVYKKGYIKSFKLALLYGLFAIGFLAALYEIAETVLFLYSSYKNANDFLGSQGDIWDAQWDMLMDILGAVFSLGIYGIIKKNK